MIRDIVITQKKELELSLKEKYVLRKVSVSSSETDMIRVIIGPRRAGKSFFGTHQLAKISTPGFVNFDDERLVRVLNFDEILEAVFSVYSNPKLLLFDEIQNLPDWELIVNRLQRQGFQLIITGSNSNLLSSELATHLTGRHLPVYLFTFSFSEYISSFDYELTEAQINDKFNNFLIDGGYPEPLIKGLNYKEYLKVLFDSILFKDIVKRYKIRHPVSLENMAAWLISNITAEFSLNSLAKQVQITSIHTIKRYLSYLEETFLFFSLSRFSYKKGEQLRSNNKIYCFDNGLYKAKAFYFNEDHGKLLENTIATELKKRSYYNNFKVFYWKGREQQEVDFVIQQDTRIIQLIQVCWDSRHKKTREREVRSMLNASVELRCNHLLVITSDEESIENFKWFGTEEEITFIPAWKWLLSVD